MDFWCLRDYCQDLALRGTKWECNKLASGPVRELPVFEVTDSEPIHEANAEAAEKEVNDVQKALSALSLLSPRIKPQPKQPSGIWGRWQKTKSKAQDQKQDYGIGRIAGDEPVLRISGCRCYSEEEESEAETSKPEHVVVAASQRGSASSSSSMPAPVVHPPPPAPVAGRPEPRVGRTTKKRSQASGTFPAFQIGPIVSHGGRVGFFADASLYSQLIFGFKSDFREAEPILLAQLRPCKRAITQGSLTEEECLLRLKRWLAGSNDADWPEQKRDFHISMGDLDNTVGHGHL